jgi:hypothetical protein
MMDAAFASFQVAALASVVGLRDTCGNFPLDVCVPMRTSRDAAPALDARASLVLMHIDGTQSLQDIAAKTELSLPDAIAVCLDLVALGVVRLPTPVESAETQQ